MNSFTLFIKTVLFWLQRRGGLDSKARIETLVLHAMSLIFCRTYLRRTLLFEIQHWQANHETRYSQLRQWVCCSHWLMCEFMSSSTIHRWIYWTSDEIIIKSRTANESFDSDIFGASSISWYSKNYLNIIPCLVWPCWVIGSLSACFMSRLVINSQGTIVLIFVLWWYRHWPMRVFLRYPQFSRRVKHWQYWLLYQQR